MFTPPHRSLAYVINGLIVISLILGGLAPVRMVQAASAPQTLSAGGDDEAGPVWVAVDVVGPTSVGPGQEVSLRATVTNVGSEKVRGARLEVREENGAKFVGPTSYPLPDLDRGQQIEVLVRGQVNARPGENLHVVVQAVGGNLSLGAGAAYSAIVRQDVAEEWQPGPGAGGLAQQRWAPGNRSAGRSRRAHRAGAAPGIVRAGRKGARSAISLRAAGRR